MFNSSQENRNEHNLYIMGGIDEYLVNSAKIHKRNLIYSSFLLLNFSIFGFFLDIKFSSFFGFKFSQDLSYKFLVIVLLMVVLYEMVLLFLYKNDCDRQWFGKNITKNNDYTSEFKHKINLNFILERREIGLNDRAMALNFHKEKYIENNKASIENYFSSKFNINHNANILFTAILDNYNTALNLSKKIDAENKKTEIKDKSYYWNIEPLQQQIIQTNNDIKDILDNFKSVINSEVENINSFDKRVIEHIKAGEEYIKNQEHINQVILKNYNELLNFGNHKRPLIRDLIFPLIIGFTSLLIGVLSLACDNNPFLSNVKSVTLQLIN